MIDTLFANLAEYGILGLIIAWLIWTNMKKDERINVLVDKLVEKNDNTTAITLTMERILLAVKGDV